MSLMGYLKRRLTMEKIDDKSQINIHDGDFFTIHSDVAAVKK